MDTPIPSSDDAKLSEDLREVYRNRLCVVAESIPVHKLDSAFAATPPQPIQQPAPYAEIDRLKKELAAAVSDRDTALAENAALKAGKEYRDAQKAYDYRMRLEAESKLASATKENAALQARVEAMEGVLNGLLIPKCDCVHCQGIRRALDAGKEGK